jgi:16S rRNA (uracil1498-N3)-methyltransferase
MTIARLFIGAALAPGAPVAVTAAQAHYLRHVLRLAPGDALAVFNGRDGEWLARIEAVAKHGGSLVALSQRRPQAGDGDLWLVFAPIKRARIDGLVEKATELGVSEMFPVATRHTAVERVNLDRLQAIAVEAAEQSERLTVPVVHPPQPLEKLLAAWPKERRLLLCDESGAAPPAAAVLQAAPPGPWAVLVGPEGGHAETELDALRKLPFVSPVGLGPRVLRSDTAAVAALALVQALRGDWGRARGS